jgi:phenylalanyl-tRNA synthetase beta chain
MLGVAREYASYINTPLIYPKQLETKDINFKRAKKIIKVDAPKLVHRFAAVEILNVQIKESPKFIKDHLNAYGIEPINNIVDITNYVMLEYGLPMHAFDLDILPNVSSKPLLTLRTAKQGEKFTTWQDTKVTLNKTDLVVSDATGRLVSIGGITGESLSGISNKTANILLESANYNHAAVRRTALKHNVFTDSSSRHSKILSSEMVETAILRAAYLIKTYSGGCVADAEDYYNNKQVINTFNFNLESEVNRLGGTSLTNKQCISYLDRLGFKTKVRGKKVHITAPVWRTDINHEEDIVEEVLRLYGYNNIPTFPIVAAPSKNITDKKLILEDKLRETMLILGLSELITEPLVKFNNFPNQIKLDNPLNKDKNGLRVSIKSTLKPVVEIYKKSGQNKIKFFECGKIYKTEGGKFKELNVLQTIYNSESFYKVKADLLAVFDSLGLGFKTENKGSNLVFKSSNIIVATLENNAYTLYLDQIVKQVNLDFVPNLSFNTGFVQTVQEHITTNVHENDNLDEIAKGIKKQSKYISRVYVKNITKDIYEKGSKKAVTFTSELTDPKNSLTKEKVGDIRDRIFKYLEDNLNLKVNKPKS